MYVEPDQISMSSSGEEDFEDGYHYSYVPSYSSELSDNNNNNNNKREEKDKDMIKDDDSYGITIFPDDHYIANFSANGVKPEIPSFERENDDDNNGKIKRARAKSDSKFVMTDDKNRNKNVGEEEGNDGLLQPGKNSIHKRLNSTGNFDNLDKSPNIDCYEEDLEMPNLLSQDLYSKVLRKRFRRAVQIIKIVRRLSSKSSISSSSYSNNQDVSDASSYYSNINSISKSDSKKITGGLSAGTHSRTSSLTSNLSNVMTSPIVFDVLPMTPDNSKSLNNLPFSPELLEKQFENKNEQEKEQSKDNNDKVQTKEEMKHE